METSRDRILTTHAGSLPRPRALTDLHLARFTGKQVDESELQRAISEATRRVLARQRECGLDVVSNGEMGRESFFTYVQHRMTGFGGRSERPLMADLKGYSGYLERLRASREGERVDLLHAPKAVGDVRYRDRQAIDAECEELRRLLDESGADAFAEAFVSSPSPGIVAAAMQNEHYADLESYIEALAEALRTEYEAVVEHGFVLQIDAPDLALERHTLFQDRPLADFLGFVRVVVDALNRALASVPRDRVRLHVCWGNYEGPHDHDVALEEILPEILRANVGALLLSMANPRHAHEWRCLERFGLPEHLLVIPGVIDTTTHYVEHPETIAERIERVAGAVGDPQRVLAGTDCGFETAAGFDTLVDEVAWAKLRALVAGARLASDRLF